MSGLTACTIISKNYLAFARVLAESFLEHHPGGRFFVLVVDRIEGAFDPEAERFTVIEVEDLPNIENLPSFLFKYTQLECNTAVKPFLLDHLFERYDLDHVLYLDPDILVLERFVGIETALEEASILLVPHLTEPIEDFLRPGETEILIAGAYNLGFIGLVRNQTTERFLKWWQKRLYEHCIVSIERGLFVDQRWIDLVPGMFEGVRILKDPGYDVAYWNLHGRTLGFEDGPKVNGEPLYFFHFSGFEVDRIEYVSRHQTRFVLSQREDLRPLFEAYRERLLAAGHRTCLEWSYAYGHYDDGAPVDDVDRRIYRELGPSRDGFGDPFAVDSPRCFRSWLALQDEAARSGAPAPPLRGGGASGTLHALLRRVYGAPLLRVVRRLTRRALGNDLTWHVWSWLDGLSGRALSASAGAPALDEGHATPLSPQANATLIAQSLEASPGLNLVGYLRAETGMGEAGRGLARAIRRTAVPLALESIDLNVVARTEDRSLELGQEGHPHGTSLYCVNADQVPALLDHLGAGRFHGRYNIGYWLWESSTFPEAWQDAFGPFQEIWTPSTYCVDVLSGVSPVPVRRIPLPVSLQAPLEVSRERLGLPEDRFLFVFAFDFLSFWERKNPLAVIRAFREAFAGRQDVGLVLKTTRSDWDEAGRERIRREIADLSVTWIDGYLTRDEVTDLFAACDAYVSLHRAEGYGLTLAESMALGLPVIATEYSGNVDFFGVGNGWPVRFELIELKEDVGPYPAGSVWAEPDVMHAAALMREVLENVEERERRAQRARGDVAARLSPDVIGRLIETRLHEIRRRAIAAG